MMDTQELLDRYLHAVKFWLPKAQKQDIAAELSEDIRSQIVEKETELGRSLNNVEVGAILKQLGSPVFVANRYLPQRYLIGPELFPIYWLVFRIVALCCLVQWVLAWIGFITFHPGHPAYSRAYDVVHENWFFTLVELGIVTLVFALLERSTLQTKVLEEWDPLKLPAMRDARRISRTSSIIDIVANAVFLVWWLPLHSLAASLLAFFPFFFLGFIPGLPVIHITLAPVWAYFYWGFSFLAVAHIALSSANLFRMVWTRTRATLRLAIDTLAAVLFSWGCKAHILAGIQAPNLAPDKAVVLTQTINLWIASAFPYCVAVGVLIVGFDLYRIFRIHKISAPLEENMAEYPHTQGAA